MLTQSCSKDTSCGNTNDIVNDYNISDDDKSKIPLKGNDTLIYISNAGDTAVLVGTGKRAFIDQVRKNNNNVDCPIYTVDNNETISIEYNGNNPELYKVIYKIYGNKERTLIEYFVNNIYSNDYPYYFNSVKFYTDSTQIYGAYYFGTPLDNINYKALYNYNYGFLKIQLNGGKIWILKM
ncbi:MAG: hypothetical protein ACEQSR_09115 [Candidatus Methylacidiphilales bacterium]